MRKIESTSNKPYQSNKTEDRQHTQNPQVLWPKGVRDLQCQSFGVIIPIAMTMRVPTGAFGLELLPANLLRATLAIHSNHLFYMCVISISNCRRSILRGFGFRVV